MSKKSPTPENPLSESDKKTLAGLRELEEHIDQRIGDLDQQPIADPDIEILAGGGLNEVETGVNCLMAPIDGQPSVEFVSPSLGGYWSEFESESSLYPNRLQGQAPDEVSLLATETLRIVNDKLANLEEKLTHKGDSLHNAQEIVEELKEQFKLLEVRLAEDLASAKKLISEEETALHDQIAAGSRHREKLYQAIRSYQNRQFFSLALLMVMALVIFGVAFSQNLNRLADSVNEHMDAMRVQLEERR